MAAAMAHPTEAPDEAPEEPLDEAAEEQPEPGAEDPIEQLQRAALEAIRTGRAILDAAESMVQDPRVVEQLVRTVAELARTAGETVAAVAARACPGPTDAAGAEQRGPADEGAGGDERMPVG